MDDKTMDAVPTTSASEMRAAGWLSRAEADAAIAAACAEMREQAIQHAWNNTCTCDCGWRPAIDQRETLWNADAFTQWREHIRQLPIPHADALARREAEVRLEEAQMWFSALQLACTEHPLYAMPKYVWPYERIAALTAEAEGKRATSP